MKTWNDYKTHVKSQSITDRKTIEDIEEHASIISTVIAQRHALGISQRELATRCGIPQSSIARIESMKTTPNLDTLLKIMHQLGLKIVISQIGN